MQISELAQGIAAKFEHSRIVFWYDSEHSFTEELEHLQTLIDSSSAEKNSLLPSNLTILNMANESVLAVKKWIELDEPQSKFLLYFPDLEPEPERDWFLDIRLYSEQFFADHSSMLLNELAIPKMALRTHIQQRKLFFANKQRLAGLKKWVTENEDEQTLDRKMIAVVVRAESASLSDILFSLLKEYAHSLKDDTQKPSFWDQLNKFDLETSLWQSLENEYGYQTGNASFSDFALKLFCTDFWCQIEVADRDWLQNNVLKTASGRATALAFMTSWRDSRTFASDYEKIADVLSSQLEIANKSRQYTPIELLECETFQAIEQSIIKGLVEDLLDSSKALDRAQFEMILSRRLSSHWVLSYDKYQSMYKAIRHAEELIYLRNYYIDGFHFDNIKAMYEAYVSDIYRFDQSYRLFNEYVHLVQSMGADILRQLDQEVEKIYTNWYLAELGLAWDKHLADEKLFDKWQIEDIPNQYDFFKTVVRKRLNQKQTKRVFVIISDALRYEVAHELSSIINSEKRFKADISTQLGVLPSYTQLGMAALLPHHTLSYQSDKGTAVYADGISTQGIDNRNTILQQLNGIAVSSKELMNWSNEESREKILDGEGCYSYHDTIDALGDKAATEDKTFEACRTAIEELKNLVNRLINRLKTTRVVITADHGFLFQQKALVEVDKTPLKSKSNNTLEAKKRYIIGYNLSSDDTYFKGYTKNTAHDSGDTEFLLPKGAQRFHFVGGAKFVHGGAMLQEICIPIVQIRELQKEQISKHEKSSVDVVPASQYIKFVNNIDKVKFIQTDSVGERFVALQLDIFIVDSDGKEVSSRETINFDSSSQIMDERIREARLKLIGSQFDRNAQYILILENSDTHTRYNTYAVTIDLAFQDDFF